MAISLDSLRRWAAAPSHDEGRSLALVRVAVAAILLTHALSALAHPDQLQGLGQLLGAHGLPPALAWALLLLQVACSAALLARRAVLAACAGHLLVLAAGIGMLYAPYWYIVGGAVVDGHPGMEFSVLLMACLLGLAWAQWPRAGEEARAQTERRGLDIIRISAALILATHPVHGVFDPAGLREFGHEMGRHGFPFGVFLVWTAMFTQILSSLALMLRRWVVPAVVGHLLVLGPGVWIAHWPDWFVAWPKHDGGMEYSFLLIACFVAVALAHGPARAEERMAPAAP